MSVFLRVLLRELGEELFDVVEALPDRFDGLGRHELVDRARINVANLTASKNALRREALHQQPQNHIAGDGSGFQTSRVSHDRSSIAGRFENASPFTLIFPSVRAPVSPGPRQ